MPLGIAEVEAAAAAAPLNSALDRDAGGRQPLLPILERIRIDRERDVRRPGPIVRGMKPPGNETPSLEAPRLNRSSTVAPEASSGEPVVREVDGQAEDLAVELGGSGEVVAVEGPSRGRGGSSASLSAAWAETSRMETLLGGAEHNPAGPYTARRMMDERRSKLASSAPWALLAVIAAIVFVAYVRLRVAGVPLERDEGEYAYAGRLILEGVPPYRARLQHEVPRHLLRLRLDSRGASVKTAWGFTPDCCSSTRSRSFWCFCVGRRLLCEFAGAAAAVVLRDSHARPVGLRGLCARDALRDPGGDRGLLGAAPSLRERAPVVVLLRAGCLFGVALVMTEAARRRFPAFLRGVSCSGSNTVASRALQGARDEADGRVRLGITSFRSSLVAAVLAAQGSLGRFWFWTFRYAREYVCEVSPSEAFSAFALGFGTVTTASLVFWVIGGDRVGGALGRAMGASVESHRHRFAGGLVRRHLPRLLLPRALLRPHAARGGVCSSVPPSDRCDTVRRRWRCSSGRSASTQCGSGAIYFRWDRVSSAARCTGQPLRRGGGDRELHQAAHGSERPDRRLGSEPEIYFYADRKAATGYIYTYALMEPQRFASQMQAEMIKEVESAHPRYLVFVESITRGS